MAVLIEHYFNAKTKFISTVEINDLTENDELYRRTKQTPETKADWHTLNKKKDIAVLKKPLKYIFVMYDTIEITVTARVSTDRESRRSTPAVLTPLRIGQ
jgi:hypothetical protein